ncbi:uncharacterized protein LOC120011927 isoform X2 [Tripterygium wilfordii]|uniref:uncharacterized protein LOC120011927 isoform X2 n=1 Tax=Tripterygium wilfordii TaxID=458696 RepID=UPI0018F7F6FA|nr:uncharacterized protein LOC120011927 isoform X2 [Tripterygium wilfordii]
MEELSQLEGLQRALSFMQSQGIIISSNNESDRFLANLVLLLIKPCGELDTNDKCNLILEYMPKFSPSFLAEASLWLGGEDKDTVEFHHESNVGGSFLSKFDGKDCGPLEMDHEHMAMVGLDAMQRANSTLEDFCRSYFMFHGMDVNLPQSIFKYLPMFSFVESYIYQLDRLNEKTLHIPASGMIALERRVEEEVNERWAAKFMDAFNIGPFKALVCVLERHGLLTERIGKELRCGEEYWALERKLCSALMNKTEISVEDVIRAIHLKSFDYRVLNLLLYQLRGEKVNDLHMEFLSISEFLVEVSDDLFDYEDDVLENNFNILRMFARIYGPSEAPAILAKHITEAEEKYDCLLRSLDSQLSLSYQRRCEEATKEGGKTSGNPLGTWSIPTVIVDENSYRSNLLHSNTQRSLGLIQNLTDATDCRWKPLVRHVNCKSGARDSLFSSDS